MRRTLLPLALVLSTVSAEAKDRATFRYTPPLDEERPVVVEAMVGPQGSDFALRLRFSKSPFGAECGMRCANAILLLDTDANVQSGLKLTGKPAENGADVAIIVQGAKDLTGKTADTYLRVKVRRLTGESQTLDDGDLIAELDHRRDPERIHVEGNTVFLLIDAGSNVPTGPKVRIVYHPVGTKAIQAQIPGLLSGRASSDRVMIFRKGGWGQAEKGARRVGSDAH